MGRNSKKSIGVPVLDRVKPECRRFYDSGKHGTLVNSGYSRQAARRIRREKGKKVLKKMLRFGEAPTTEAMDDIRMAYLYKDASAEMKDKMGIKSVDEIQHQAVNDIKQSLMGC